MRKSNRRSNAKKEKIIMIASSGFVLAALTMTGIYMRTQDAEVEDDGYTLDLAELENSSAGDVNMSADGAGEGMEVADGGGGTGFGNQVNLNSHSGHKDDAMDYMPLDGISLEVGSGLVEIPGLTDKKLPNIKQETGNHETVAKGGSLAEANEVPDVAAADTKTQQTVTENVETVPTLQFTESDGLLRPVGGEVLLPFSMDGSIYFSTLNHYKYNPALMLSAEEGTAVSACADGNVISIYEDAQIGTAVVMEIGDGYQITYGQLKDVTIGVGDYVREGQVFASVAAPTKYFVVEGCNLYLKVSADGAPVDPEVLFR